MLHIGSTFTFLFGLLSLDLLEKCCLLVAPKWFHFSLMLSIIFPEFGSFLVNIYFSYSKWVALYCVFFGENSLFSLKMGCFILVSCFLVKIHSKWVALYWSANNLIRRSPNVHTASVPGVLSRTLHCLKSFFPYSSFFLSHILPLFALSRTLP